MVMASCTCQPSLVYLGFIIKAFFPFNFLVLMINCYLKSIYPGEMKVDEKKMHINKINEF
jgi:hypothetical protein